MIMQDISWTTPQYIYREKTVDWYWIVGIVTISIVLICIIFQNLILAILIFISAFLLTILGSRKPKNIQIVIHAKGIRADNVEHPYKEYYSYWVQLDDPYPRIILKPKKVLSTYITFLIPREKSDSIQKALGRFLKEERHEESLLEKIFIYFGF